MSKTWVIGDIHGANRALEQVLEICKFNNEEDTLISLGDIADGWHEVPKCVDTLLGIKNLIALRGNHDVWLLDWLKEGKINPMWLPQGGQATYDAYIETGNVANKEHLHFFDSQLDYYIDDDNNLFTHGGWDYTWRLDFKEAGLYPVNSGSKAKECHWDRTLFMACVKHSDKAVPKLLAKALSQYNKIFIGHTSLPHPYKPFIFNNLTNLDTGAGWNGRLTIMDVETGKYYQSDLIQELYPDHKGR